MCRTFAKDLRERFGPVDDHPGKIRREDLPKLGYLTQLDYFLLGSTALVFLTLVEATACSWLEGRGLNHAVSHLDRHSRWVFPLAYAILLVAVFVV